ncbi:AAA family ATPase [Desulfovibrio sp. ZJ200]|uniref:AAA family ATPase n=1 Tax=Desulfovibrio sp. ZJ200 TaxID=2709792 RepID=UPI0013EE2ED4|nr:AAA family ATPase [Desulfovibrio sp. ZJ200]
MKLSSIHIQNYRPLEDISIDFNSNLNVIYGVNGIGKSSILYAIHDFLVLLNTLSIQNNDLHLNKLPTDQQINLFPFGRLHDPNKDAEITIKFTNDNVVKATHFSKGFDENNQFHDNKKFFSRNGTSVNSEMTFMEVKFASFIPNLVNLGLVGVQNPDGSFGFSVKQPPRFTYTRGIFDFEEFKRNFEELENLENQKKLKDTTYNHPALQKIRNAIPKIAENLHGLTIDREKPHKPLCSIKNGVYMDIEDQLSAGEASIIGLITKIALDENKFGESFPIIIDEIDSSLHPSWQIQVCKVLKDTFPDLQFILTSHSPFIWAGLNKDEIIWLDYDVNNKIVRKQVMYGKGGSIESIISQYFKENNYDKDFSDELHNIEDKIKSKNNEEVEKILNDLKIKYGDIPIIDQLRLKNRLFRL